MLIHKGEFEAARVVMAEGRSKTKQQVDLFAAMEASLEDSRQNVEEAGRWQMETARRP